MLVSAMMQIFVEDVDGKTIALEVECSEGVGSVKTKIQETVGVPHQEPRLIEAPFEAPFRRLRRARGGSAPSKPPTPPLGAKILNSYI